MTPEAGELNQRGQFSQRSNVVDTYGDLKREVWEDIGEWWGKLTFVSEANKDIAKGFSDSATYQWLMRYRPEVNNQCKMKLRNDEYFVAGVRHDVSGKKEWTQCFLSSLDTGNGK